MKYNFNTYNNTQCRTCIWLFTGEEVRTEAGNIEDLDRGAFEWSWL